MIDEFINEKLKNTEKNILKINFDTLKIKSKYF